MRKPCEDALQAGQPALIVTYGRTTRKHRPLDRDILVLGRAAGCDVGLSSPEVASVHCLILRTPGGWRIRDCAGGRHATRVNGRAIHEETLHDTDVLHIGTFTFEVRLPASKATPVPGSTPVVDDRLAARLKRLQRSRRNLIRLALRMRRRARPNNPSPPTLAELEQQAARLRALQRDYEALVQEYEGRLNVLEKAEREVCDERATLERECIERQTRLEQMEHELARRQAETDSRLQVGREERPEQCSQTGPAHMIILQTPPASTDAPSAAAYHEFTVQLDRRSQELNHFAAISGAPGSNGNSKRPTTSRFGKRPSAGGSSAKTCRPSGTPLTLGHSNDTRNWPTSATGHAARPRRWTRHGRNCKPSATPSAARSTTATSHWRSCAASWTSRQPRRTSNIPAAIERELNAFRLELERDRRDLNAQLAQLQQCQADMEATARESELQMSRERAVIARERTELTRLREEARMTRDRAAREGGVRERLSNLHILRQEVLGPPEGQDKAHGPGARIGR